MSDWAKLPLVKFNVMSNFFCMSTEFTAEPKAVPERPHRQTSDGETEVGNGVQGLPGVCGRLHEHAGKFETLWMFQFNMCCLCFKEETS